MTWQPIETAPKEVKVLVWDGEDTHFAYWVQYTAMNQSYAIWYVVNNGDYIDGGYGQDYKMGNKHYPLPTHWKPLTPPSLEEAI